MNPTLEDLLNVLLSPRLSCTFDDLPGHWRQSTLRVVCERPELLEEGPWFTAAIRGAWGRQLHKLNAGGASISPFNVFFSTLDNIRVGRSIPPPFALSANYRGNSVIIELTLFGIADCWRQNAFDALMAALADGIAIVPGRKGFRAVWCVREASWTRSESTGVPKATTSWVRLTFHTPVRLGPRRALGVRWPDLIVSLADRASRFARWQGLNVEADLGTWRRLGEGTRFRDEGMRPCAWDRRSGGQGGKKIPMVGLTGKLDIERPGEALMPLLVLGATMHVGGHTALGLGRYELFCRT